MLCSVVGMCMCMLCRSSAQSVFRKLYCLFGRSTEQNVECVRTEMDSDSVLIGDELEFLLGFFTAFGNFLQSIWEK